MIGKYYTEDLQEWYLSELENARKVLIQFNLLNQLFDGFKRYENKQYSKTRNIILIKCLRNFQKVHNPKSIESLVKTEESIKLFDIINWKKKAKFNEFKSKFCSDSYYTSLSPYTELILAKILTERENIGKDNIELYPKLKGGGFSDVLAKVKGRSIYIEIGNLTESKPEEKIQQILDASAKHIGEKLGINCYFHIEVDTAEFVFDNGRFDVDKSISKLTSEIDKYGLHKLAGFNGLIIIGELIDMISNISIYEELSKKITLPPNIEEYLNLMNDAKIKTWIGYYNIGKLGASKLIKSIIGAPLSTLLVEIHTEGFYPSKAAMAERESFINHIIRQVKEQLDEEQIQPNEANIIIVQGFNWTIWGEEEFESIFSRIHKFFESNQGKYLCGKFLSGIAVFEGFNNDFNNVMYVNNKYVDPLSKIDQSDVEQLGFKWFEGQ